MNPTRPLPSPPLRPRGSALLTVIIFTTFMALLAGSILTWSVNERFLNTRTVYWIEARNAAEALCEYGAAQVNSVTSNLTLPPSVEQTFFNPTKAISSNYNPLQLPVLAGSTTSFFNPNTPGNGLTQESHVDTNQFESPAGGIIDANGLELIAGQQVHIPLGSSKLFLIDPKIPENVNDPYVGLLVERYDYNILAKATVVPTGFPPITAYVKQTVSMRGAPLFDWVIFYATSDLEIYPGQPMNVTGPVHTNFDMYINPTDSGSINFAGPVTTTGHIFHSMENSTDGQSAMSNNDVTFSTGSTQVSMQSGGTWYDSTYGNDNGITGPDTPGSTLYTLANNQTNKTNFTIHAEKIWPSNVLTKDMGVLPFNPKGFNNFLAAGTDPNGNLYYPDTPYVDNGVQVPVAGATVTIDQHIIDYNGTLANGNVSFFNDPPDSNFPTMLTSSPYYVARKGLEDVKYANLANLYILVNVNTSTSPYSAVVTYYGPYNSTKIGTAFYGPNGGILLGQVQYSLVAGVFKGRPGPLVGVGAGKTGLEPYGLVSFIPYQISGGNVTSGLYDQRQSTPVDLVQVNVNALNRALMDVNLDLSSPTGGDSHTFQGEPVADAGAKYLDAIVNNQDPNPNGAVNSNHAVPAAGGASTIWGSGSMGYTGANVRLNDNTAEYRDGATQPGGWNGTVYVDVEETPALNPNVANTHEIGVGIGNGQTTTQSVSGVQTIVNNAGPDQDHATINLVPNNLQANGTPSVNGPISSYAIGSVPDAIVGPQNGLNYGAGLTIATNSPVFVVGNFNADGTQFGTFGSAHNASVLPDDDLGGSPVIPSAECPVAIIGDAVTFLSPNYFNSTTPVGTAKFTDPVSSAALFPHVAPDGTIFANGNVNGVGSNAYISKNTAGPNATGSAEVAMAMVSGLVLTNAAAASGGVHNLPRYLENWGGFTHVIRGSLVNLYSSKIAIQPYSTAGYYSPPTRDWGYAQLFSNGVLPPSTPLTFSNRRIYFNDLSKAQYIALRADPTWGWPAPATFSAPP
jgi:hypothetical protein